MKRVSLKQEFHGEPEMAQEGAAVAGQGADEVAMEITHGNLTLRVPSTVPDDRVTSTEYLELHLQCVLELEDGSDLTLVLNEGRESVDVRLSPPQKV